MNPGPWMNEPDDVSFVHASLQCKLRRHRELGHWCGYVMVPKSHPIHCLDMGDLHEYQVHGGVPYAGYAFWTKRRLWAVGFDCGHYNDYSPLEPDFTSPANYRTVQYAREQCERLAEQIASTRPCPCCWHLVVDTNQQYTVCDYMHAAHQGVRDP